MRGSGAFETIVGALVLVLAGVALLLGYSASGKGREQGAYRISAVFGRIDGVAEGAEVRIAGVDIGAVSARALDPLTYEARLEMRIDRSVKIPEDSIAKIVADGLLGGAFVSIEPGASEEFLAEGGVITQTQGSVDLLGLAVQAFTSNAGKPSQSSE